MSRSVVLLGPPDLQPAQLSDLLRARWPSHHWFTPGGTPELQDVTAGVAYLSIDTMSPAAEVARDYLDNDDLPAQLRAQLHDKAYYLVTFNDETLFVQAISLVLSQLPARSTACGSTTAMAR